MLKLDRTTFFARVRHGPFPGKLTQRQVDGLNDLLDAWEKFGTDDERHLAYCLATSYHETGGRMQPVREGFASSDKSARALVAHRKYGRPVPPHGHVYYGRGDVQLTWAENYARMGEILGLPLLENPDLALESRYSKMILIEGMTRGLSGRGDFTGKALGDYFNDRVDDPLGARRIVNGTDKARLIAGYHEEFLDAVVEAKAAYEQPDLFSDAENKKAAADARPDTLTPGQAAKDETFIGALVGLVGSVIGSAKEVIEGVDDPYVLVVFLVIAAGLALVVFGRVKLNRLTGD